jgi:hypothetical protein
VGLLAGEEQELDLDLSEGECEFRSIWGLVSRYIPFGVTPGAR